MTTLRQTFARTLTARLSGLLPAVLTVAAAGPALGQGTGAWTATGSISGPSRSHYTATLLQTGQVLVAGGEDDNGSASVVAELYNPSTRTWTQTGSLTNGRFGHTATLLKNGEVLITGGFTSTSMKILKNAELYNPSTGTWSYTAGLMSVPREFHSAVLLRSGEVLVAGGETNLVTGVTTNTADLYNPSTGAFTATGNMNEARDQAQLTLLQNGEALIAGGGEGEAGCTGELFSNGQWTLTADLAVCGVTQDAAAVLPNGNVLVEDGNTANEFYNPSTNVWQVTLDQPDVSGPLALLDTGNVLVAGSALVGGGSNAALYDPSTNEWTPAASAPLVAQTLTPLLNGQVLATTEGNVAALFTP